LNIPFLAAEDSKADETMSVGYKNFRNQPRLTSAHDVTKLVSVPLSSELRRWDVEKKRLAESAKGESGKSFGTNA
jgi:hypothetical protein